MRISTHPTSWIIFTTSRTFTRAHIRTNRARGRCLLVDCHSFPSAPIPCDLDQTPERPDVCLGTDARHTPSWLVEMAVALVEAGGLTVTVDRPYAGALVPDALLGRVPTALALMVEVNRRLYMDESTGRKTQDFDATTATIRRVLTLLTTGIASRV